MSIAQMPHENENSPDGVERFKDFLINPPEIARIVFSYTHPFSRLPPGETGMVHVVRPGGEPEPVEEEYITRHYHGAVGRNGFFLREIPSPDLFAEKTSRSFDRSAPQFAGRYSNTRFHVKKGLILEEVGDGGRGDELVVGKARSFEDRLNGCLAFGIWRMDPTSAKWEGDTLFFEYQTITGQRTARVITRGQRVAGMNVHDVVFIEYEYPDDNLARLGVPSRITVRTRNKIRSEFYIHHLQIADGELTADAFIPDHYVDPADHQRVKYDERIGHVFETPQARQEYMEALKQHPDYRMYPNPGAGDSFSPF